MHAAGLRVERTSPNDYTLRDRTGSRCARGSNGSGVRQTTLAARYADAKQKRVGACSGLPNVQVQRLITTGWVVESTLPTERLILVFEPRERVLKMLQIKIRPLFIPDIEIRIDRLHREKPAQSASSSPAYNQIQT